MLQDLKNQLDDCNVITMAKTLKIRNQAVKNASFNSLVNTTVLGMDNN